MKQGSGRSSMSGGKIEPRTQIVHPAGVSQIGETVDARAIEPVRNGRGYKAPMSGHQVHHSGSQGRHDD